MERKIKKIFFILFFIGISIPFFCSAQVFNRDLYFGLVNDADVFSLQKFLASVGVYAGPITGNFFSLTREGVKNFQEKEGITPVAGYFGPKTRAKVNDILSSGKQASAIVSDNQKEAKTEAAGTETTPNTIATYRILIIGDSYMALGGGIGNPLEKDLLSFKDVAVYRFGKVSSGLSQPTYFNWNQKAQEMISQYNPNVAIIMIGANDNQNLRTAEGKIIWYGNPGWSEEYAGRVSNFLKIFEENNITVFWVSQPIMRDKKFSDAMKNLNSVDENEIKNHKNAYFISIWNLLADSQGNYTDYLPDASGKLKLARVWDGIHVHYFAGGIVSQEIIKQIKTVINLEPK
jgi:hypothetical protein